MTDARDLLETFHFAVKASWDDARAHWRDIVAADFERRFWAKIDQKTVEFLAECDRFEDVLSQAESALRNMD